MGKVLKIRSSSGPTPPLTINQSSGQVVEGPFVAHTLIYRVQPWSQMSLSNHPECGAMLVLVTWLLDLWQVTSCWGMPESALGLAVQLAGYAVQGCQLL